MADANPAAAGAAMEAMAEALPDDGEIHSCELMKKHVQTSKSWFEKSDVKHKIQIHQFPD